MQLGKFFDGVTFHRISRLVDPFVKVHILIIKLDRFLHTLRVNPHHHHPFFPVASCYKFYKKISALLLLLLGCVIFTSTLFYVFSTLFFMLLTSELCVCIYICRIFNDDDDVYQHELFKKTLKYDNIFVGRSFSCCEARKFWFWVCEHIHLMSRVRNDQRLPRG
jgi:hypothetical protein